MRRGTYHAQREHVWRQHSQRGEECLHCGMRREWVGARHACQVQPSKASRRAAKREAAREQRREDAQ